MKLQKKDKNESLHNRHFVLCYMSFSLWATDFAVFGLYLGEWVSLSGLYLGEWVSLSGLYLGEWVSLSSLYLGEWVSLSGLYLGERVSLSGLYLGEWVVCLACILVSKLVCHHYIWFLDLCIAVMGYVLQSEKQYTIHYYYQYCMDNVLPTILWHTTVFDIPHNCRSWSPYTAAW